MDTENLLLELNLIIMLVIGWIWPARPYRLLPQEWKQDLFWHAAVDFGLPALMIWARFYVVERFAEEMAPRGQFALPWVAQVVLTVLALDLTRYWVHRLSHSVQFFWDTHKLHHSTLQLTTLSDVRTSWLAIVVCDWIPTLFLVILGFNPSVIAASGAYFAWHGQIVHSNINFNPRWLRNWIVTPNFHAWHHARAMRIPGGQNFAAVFSFWDRIFGTMYHSDSQPKEMGFDGMEHFPSTALGRLIYPIQRLWKRDLPRDFPAKGLSPLSASAAPPPGTESQSAASP